ncbi:hypothetical protein NEMBOFW57_009329 [Staphylotrichum longicolle]|uniref:Methyltransferase n=1 Tax=Staphylotrichum longicolle TaxID=669026 RepID=A0AAD4EPB3_9PEZI|nr:hypothetical protein NEMBOFW57_009329 [Staphylotrichum longicolle]
MSSPSANPASTTAAPSPPAPEAQTAAEPVHDILPGEHWTQQPAPAADDDADSTYAETLGSSTNSLSTSILEYRTIQGRTFHSDRTPAEYWCVSDFGYREAVGESILGYYVRRLINGSSPVICSHHSLTLVLDGKLFLAPVDMNKAKKVLDIGTGTGIWAIDLADEHPNVQVIGTDISPIQPGWVPPNVFFEMEDATQAWTFEENSFDFVHIRYLFGSIPDWDELFKQAYRVLKPGGYIETFEADALVFSEDGTVKEGSPLDQWGKVFKEGGKKFGRSFLGVNEDVQRKGLEAAGFSNLKTFDYNTPMTGWSTDKKWREIGEYSHAAMEQDLEGMILYMFKEVMGWSTVEIHAYIGHLRRQLRDKSVHPVAKLRLIYAQKPEDATAA